MARSKPDYAKGGISQPGAKRRAKSSEAVMESGTASDCLDQIRTYERAAQKWEKRSSAIVKRYRDERDDAQHGARAFNILWSNIEVLKPTLYARQPSCEVVRRFKDSDPLALIGAEIAERATDSEIENSFLHDRMKQAVLDRLLVGRGQIWTVYDPEMAGDDDQRAKVRDNVRLDYVAWDEFGHSAVPTWAEVTKVWRWRYFDRAAIKARFENADKWIDRLEFNQRHDGKEETEREPEARVAEVWDKKTKRVYWVSKQVPDYLDEYDDPLGLEGFFPCPRPLYGTLTNDTLVPVPDFYMYQDQANEVDKLTGRINRLTDALKVAGVYDQSVKALQDILDPRGVADNTLVPVNMNDLTGRGGVNSAVQMIDLTFVINTLTACYEARTRAIQAIYEITGISDVLRGSTDPNETARAQDIKAQFGGTRIRDKQQDVSVFARDVIRIVTEIIVEKYEPETIYEMTNAGSFIGVVPTPDGRQFPDIGKFAAALKLLRDDKMRSFRIDIETDSTIALDEAEAKQDATEFITAVGGFLNQALPVVQAMPAMAPLAGEFLTFIARRFKAGRTLESSIERAVGAALQEARQPKPPPPEVIKAQSDAEKAKADIALQQQKAAAEQANATANVQLQREKGAAELQFERERAAAELQLEREKAEASFKLERYKAELKAQNDAAAMKQKAEQASLQLSFKELDGAATKMADGAAAGQKYMTDMIRRITEGQKAIGDGIGSLSRLISAPQVIERDKKTGRVIGSRRVVN